MTPYEIELLLRFHCRAYPLVDWPDAPILEETLLHFASLSLIEWDALQFWKAGPALPCYIEAITAIRAPVRVWQIPA
ncbi:MAG: hypothetical protein A3E01_04615 [Gammaproteobacteria bacterium RIFCSPHIGHO2_12_FULL_63_22]|nr:MAG: hypothetical protein A3E01_04615 [Gammaproteobacteria bacterium RIFCSPHIGHO2_12_FULL_63_22]